MTELKPCPCCGPKAFIIPTTKCDPPIGEHCWTAELRCRECGLNISRTAATEKEALDQVIEAWNTRAERTCTIENQYDGFPIHRIVRLGRCSKCGEIINTEHKFCFECGAKVVE